MTSVQPSSADRNADHTPKVVGIVVALPEELSTLTRQKLVQGECVNLSDNILVSYSGAGADNAQLAAQQLIARGASHLISWGCAGALATDLKAGDLVLAEQVQSHADLIAVDSVWRNHLITALNNLPVHGGILLESQQIVANSADKQSLQQQTGAAAVDMESAAVARVAQAAEKPCLVIRVIADSASFDLPQAVVQSLNSQGQVELGKLLIYLVTHLTEIPALIKLGLHFSAAQKTLKQVTQQLNFIINF